MFKDNSKKRLLEVMQRVDPSFKPRLNEDFNQSINEDALTLTPEQQKEIASFIPEIEANYEPHRNMQGKTLSPLRNILYILWENYNYKSKNIDFRALENFVTDWVTQNMPDKLSRGVQEEDSVTEDLDKSTLDSDYWKAMSKYWNAINPSGNLETEIRKRIHKPEYSEFINNSSNNNLNPEDSAEQLRRMVLIDINPNQDPDNIPTPISPEVPKKMVTGFEDV